MNKQGNLTWVITIRELWVKKLSKSVVNWNFSKTDSNSEVISYIISTICWLYKFN